MSWSTIADPDDIPNALRQQAYLFRTVETRRYKLAWITAAYELERLADELEPLIRAAKVKESVSRARVKI